MTEAVQSSIDRAADALDALLRARPADERQARALYHLDRLRRAVRASHQEAVRFAAFTLHKTVRDASATWGPDLTAAMEQLKAALNAQGHHY